MEFEFSFSSFSILLVTFLLFVSMILKLTDGRTINLPPGPWKLPIIGNLHQLIVSPLPHQKLRDLAKKHGPLMHLQLGELSTVVVSSAEFAKEVMRTHDIIFASRPFIIAADILFYNRTNTLFSPYGSYWRKLRKILALELLSVKRVQSFRSIREEEASNFINWITSNAGSPINFTNKIQSVTNDITLRAAFSMKYLDHQVFVSVVRETLESIAGLSIVDMFPSVAMLQQITGVRSKLEKLHQETDKILENIIRKHKLCTATLEADESDVTKDLVEVLLKVQQDGDSEFRLTTDNIKAIIWDICLAATDTTATTIEWAMVELMKNPKLMKKTQAEVREVFNKMGKFEETAFSEMKFLKAVIKETLRLHPPGPLLPRECRETCEINGFDIPVKTKVLVNVWAIGRDPEYWSEPESFIPERFFDSPVDYKGTNFEYLPFGAGRRICPGMSFASAAMDVLLASLLYHFDWKLPNDMKHEDLDMTEKFGIAIRRKDELNIIAVPYHPSLVA